MRIVTGGTGETVSASPLAFALQQCFPLAGRSAVRAQLSGVNEVGHGVGKIFTRHKIGERAPWGVDSCLAFQVTLQADRVSLAHR